MIKHRHIYFHNLTFFFTRLCMIFASYCADYLRKYPPTEYGRAEAETSTLAEPYEVMLHACNVWTIHQCITEVMYVCMECIRNWLWFPSIVSNMKVWFLCQHWLQERSFRFFALKRNNGDSCGIGLVWKSKLTCNYVKACTHAAYKRFGFKYQTCHTTWAQKQLMVLPLCVCRYMLTSLW